MYKLLKLFKQRRIKVIISTVLVLTLGGTTTVFAQSHLRVKHALEEARMLFSQGEYQEAVKTLNSIENKWSLPSLKSAISYELEELIEAQENEVEAENKTNSNPLPSPNPSPIIKYIPANPSPLATPTTTSFSPVPTIPEKKKVPINIKSLNTTLYCDELGVNEVSIADSSLMQIEEGYQICISAASLANDICSNTCRETSGCGSIDIGYCDYEMQNNCLSTCSVDHQNSLNECLNLYNADKDKYIGELDKKINQYCL